MDTTQEIEKSSTSLSSTDTQKNKNYHHIVQHNTIINTDQIIGRGAFGIIYKGNIFK